MSDLAKRDKLIVKLHTEDFLTYREIGEEYRISRQRVEQIVKRKCPNLPSRATQKMRTEERNQYIFSQIHKTNKELATELKMNLSYIGKIRYGTKYNSAYKETIEERFWKYVNKTDSCWLWTGSFNRDSRQTQFQKSRKSYTANRFAWELLKGKIPANTCLLHTCKNYTCVNPDHMEAVSFREMILLKRDSSRCGSGGLSRKFTNEQVLEARQRVANGEKISFIARELEVPYNTLYGAIKGTTYKHVKFSLDKHAEKE